MRSAGNDIVALRSVNKERTSQFRFYSKILSASEQSLYHQPQWTNLPFENYVWLLWSVKESVYKYLKRSIPELVFSPTKICIQNIKIPAANLMNKSKCVQWQNTGQEEAFYCGTIIYGSHVLYSRSKITDDWMATVANDDEKFDNVCWGIQSIEDAGYYNQSKAARTLLLQKLYTFFPFEMQVKKSLIGYPVICKGNQDMYIPVSLSHDDCLVAYSLLLNSDNYPLD